MYIYINTTFYFFTKLFLHVLGVLGVQVLEYQGFKVGTRFLFGVLNVSQLYSLKD